MSAQYIKIRLKKDSTLYLALTQWIEASRLTIVGVATTGSVDGDDYGWYVDDTVLNTYSGVSSLLTNSEEHTNLGRYVIGRNASASNRAELFPSSSSSFGTDPAQYQFDFDYFFEYGILKLVGTSFALTAASAANRAGVVFMTPDTSNQNQQWEIVDQYGNVIEKPQEISSWQDPVQITTVSAGVSSSGTANIHCYEAGYVRYRTPSYVGKLVCKTTTHDTNPDCYSHLSTTILGANSGTERYSAVTGDILISNDDGMNDGSFDTKIEWEHTNNTRTYYNWYINGPWAATGTYQIPWQLNYYRQYTITFNANGGINAPSELVFYEDNLLVTMPISIPKRDDYTFLGWSSSETASTPEYLAGYEYTIMNNNFTLYAVWGEAKKTLTYNVNGGTGTLSQQSVASGSSIDIDFTTKLTPPAGYFFKGWDENSTVKIPTYRKPNGETSIVLDKDITLYAIWWPEFKWQNAEGAKDYSKINFNKFITIITNIFTDIFVDELAPNKIKLNETEDVYYNKEYYNNLATPFELSINADDPLKEDQFTNLLNAYKNY